MMKPMPPTPARRTPGGPIRPGMPKPPDDPMPVRSSMLSLRLPSRQRMCVPPSSTDPCTDGAVAAAILSHELLLQFRTEAAQLLARELLAEVARRQAEMRPEAAGEHFGAGEAAGSRDILDRNVAVEQGVAGRLQADL